jgi:hypothetical protein
MTATPAPATPVAQLTEQARAWVGVSLRPHTEGAVAFRLDDATIGVLHHDGLLEVPVPTPIRTVLVEEDLAVAHGTRPGGDWVAAQVQSRDDVDPAALLLRLSYLYRRLLRSQDAATLRRIRIELGRYALPDALDALFDTMLAKRDPDASTLPGRPPTPS